MSPTKANPTQTGWTVEDILGWLQAKRTTLISDIEASEKGPRGGGRQRGFRADTPEKSLAWLQGPVDADFLLPELWPFHHALQKLGVANLPPWIGEPPDQTATQDLLTRMISACQSTLADPKKPPPAESTATLAGLEPARFRHGLDYRDCTWNGERYTFTATQAACVQVLWEERDKGTLELSQQLLLEKAGAESQQLKDVFKNHPAWKKMIVAGSKTGLYKLADPT
jgi:hypothetical protein